MGFNKLAAIIIFGCLIIDPSMASSNFDSVHSYEVRQISKDYLGQERIDSLYRQNIGYPGIPQDGTVTPTDRAGKVVAVARDLVALGEDVYRLVIKGKPSIATNYAPISVIPKVGSGPVDLLETENWKIPISKTYEIEYKNPYQIRVLVFRFNVIYSYGGSYNGKGAYLTAVQVVPEYVRALFGYDFTATMKLGGIQNQGTRDNPIAAATILVEHSLGTVIVASTGVDKFFILGNGRMKKF